MDSVENMEVMAKHTRGVRVLSTESSGEREPLLEMSSLAIPGGSKGIRICVKEIRDARPAGGSG